MTLLLAFLLVSVLIALPCSIISLVMILALKNSTHRIQWVDAKSTMTDEELEEQMLAPAVKQEVEDDFSEDSKKPRPFPSLLD